VAAVVFGVGGTPRSDGDPMQRAEVLVGLLPGLLPPGVYSLATKLADLQLAASAWALGSYRFDRYKGRQGVKATLLTIPPQVDRKRLTALVEAVNAGRDLINTPASDMGPEQLQRAAFDLAERHDVVAQAIVGDELLAQNFPMIHMVGRASTREPRLIELRWQGGKRSAKALSVSLIGKGICFDTGGLDLKPSSAMLLMKKDMGGAATVLSLAHMIMAADLDVRLRVLLAVAENSVSGNAFRPGDVVRSRAGISVEIGNTDAEGRLVMADALSFADEEAPDLMISVATLTGAARVALGPELPPFYCTDEALSNELGACGLGVADPVWRMPFWSSYESLLDSPVADMNNVSEGPFAGSVTAALFLRRFVRNAKRYAHLDIYGWRPSPKALGPKGGEVQSARALFATIERMVRKQRSGK
jgi:leucyl aminopeptidase